MSTFELVVQPNIAEGPLEGCDYIRLTERLDRGGEILAEASGADPRMALVQQQRMVEYVAGHQAGSGRITGITRRADAKGKFDITITADDRLGDLRRYIVHDLELGTDEDHPISVVDAIDAIMAYATGWTWDTTTYADDAQDIYLEFDGETVLAALGAVAEAVGHHFRGDTDADNLVWYFKDQPHSGLVIEQSGDTFALATNPDVLILDGDLDQDEDSTELVTRIYAVGEGNAKRAKTLQGSEWTSPDPDYEIIEQPTGRWCIRHIPTDDIAPIARRVPYKDVKSKKVLAQKAFEDLKTRVNPRREYRLTVTNLQRPLYVGWLVSLPYRLTYGSYTALDINEDLVVLEKTTDLNDRQRVTLVVSTIDRENPSTDVAVLTGLSKKVSAMESKPQNVEHATAADTALVAAEVSDVNVPLIHTANTFDAEQSVIIAITDPAVSVDALTLSATGTATTNNANVVRTIQAVAHGAPNSGVSMATANTVRAIIASAGNTGAGTVASAIAAYLQVVNSAAGTLTEGVGVRVLNPSVSVGGTIGTLYGIYVVAQSAATVTTAYALYLAGSSDRTYIAGKVGLGVDPAVLSGTGKLHMHADTFRLDTARTLASSAATGNAGEFCWDDTYLYIRGSAGWKRVALSTF